jgi:hypothetical protein
MITVSLFLSMTLILVISFVLISKKNNPLVFFFVLMCMEYLFTSFISVIVDNENLWKVSKEPWHFLMFRISEVIIIPLMLLLYLEIDRRLSTAAKRLLLIIAATFIMVGLERTLPILDMMKYVNWKLWASFLTWFLFLAITSMLGRIFCRILYKEGITK